MRRTVATKKIDRESKCFVIRDNCQLQSSFESLDIDVQPVPAASHLASLVQRRMRASAQECVDAFRLLVVYRTATEPFEKIKHPDHARRWAHQDLPGYRATRLTPVDVGMFASF